LIGKFLYCGHGLMLGIMHGRYILFRRPDSGDGGRRYYVKFDLGNRAGMSAVARRVSPRSE